MPMHPLHANRGAVIIRREGDVASYSSVVTGTTFDMMLVIDLAATYNDPNERQGVVIEVPSIKVHPAFYPPAHPEFQPAPGDIVSYEGKRWHVNVPMRTGLGMVRLLVDELFD